MAKAGFGIVRPISSRFRRDVGGMTVHKRIKNKARRIGFGFKKGIKKGI